MATLDFIIVNDFYLLKNDPKELHQTSNYGLDNIINTISSNTLSVTFMLFYRFFKIYCAYKL